MDFLSLSVYRKKVNKGSRSGQEKDDAESDHINSNILIIFPLKLMSHIFPNNVDFVGDALKTGDIFFNHHLLIIMGYLPALIPKTVVLCKVINKHLNANGIL